MLREHVVAECDLILGHAGCEGEGAARRHPVRTGALLPSAPGPDGSATSVAVLFDDVSIDRAHAAGELALRLVEASGCKLEVRLESVRADDGPATDPYGLTARCAQLDVAAAVLVAPRRRGSRRLLPGPVIAGVPVGIVQVDDSTQLCTHLSTQLSADDDRSRSTGEGPDPAAPWVVGAMAKNVFLGATETWSRRLAAVHPTVDLRADRARRGDFLDGLRAGPGVVLYAGHGSPRGWAGYQALRIDHVAAGIVPGAVDPGAVDTGTRSERPDARPAGLVTAFACRTLARNRGRWPFGSQLVERGVAGAYLAPAMAVYTADAERLAEIVVDVLTDASPSTVADLMRLVDDRSACDEAARRAWETFRLVGNPLTPIV